MDPGYESPCEHELLLNLSKAPRKQAVDSRRLGRTAQVHADQSTDSSCKS